MSKFLFAPFMMNLGESQRLSKLANCLYEQGHDIHILGDNYYPFLFNNDAYRYHHCVEDKSVYIVSDMMLSFLFQQTLIFYQKKKLNASVLLKETCYAKKNLMLY